MAEESKKLTWKAKAIAYSTAGFILLSAGYGLLSTGFKLADWISAKRKQDGNAAVLAEPRFSIKIDENPKGSFDDTLNKVRFEEKPDKVRDIEVFSEAYAERKITNRSVEWIVSKLWSDFLNKTPEIRKEIENNAYGIIKINNTGRYKEALQSIDLNVDKFQDIKFAHSELADAAVHKKRIGPHECPLECTVGETIVHEIFHDFWYQLLMEPDRKDFEKAIYELYAKLDNVKEAMGKLVSKTAKSMDKPELKKLKELEILSKDFGLANYDELFFNDKYRTEIGIRLMETARYLNGLAEKSGFENVKDQLKKEADELFALRSYLTGASLVKVKTYKEDVVETIIKQHPDALQGIKTAEEFFALEDILGPKMKYYQKKIYKNESESTAKDFCGVEGFAFLAEIVYAERNPRVLPVEVRQLYKRFIDFGKLSSDK